MWLYLTWMILDLYIVKDTIIHHRKIVFLSPKNPNPQKRGRILEFLTTRFIAENFSVIKRVV